MKYQDEEYDLELKEFKRFIKDAEIGEIEETENGYQEAIIRIFTGNLLRKVEE